MKITKTQLKQIIKEEISKVLNEKSNEAWDKLRSLADQKGELTVDEFKPLIDQFVGTDSDQYATVDELAWEAWKTGLIPGDYYDNSPAVEYLDLDSEAKAGRDLRSAAKAEQRAEVKEVGDQVDYIFRKFNDEEGLSNKGTSMHSAKALDDARRRARGLELEKAGGGGMAYKHFLIIPDSKPLSKPDKISSWGYRSDPNFANNSKLRHKIINQSEYMEQDLQDRMDRLSQGN